MHILSFQVFSMVVLLQGTTLARFVSQPSLRTQRAQNTTLGVEGRHPPHFRDKPFYFYGMIEGDDERRRQPRWSWHASWIFV